MSVPIANDLNHLRTTMAIPPRSWLTGERTARGLLLEVPYEGLVADPEHGHAGMLEFVGLPWDPQCLEFHQTQRAVITASKWQVRQKINSASVGRWRNYGKYLAPLQRLVPG